MQAAILEQSVKAPLDDAGLLQAENLESLVYRPAQLRGTWDARHTVYLDNRQMQGRVGFFVMTPLLLEGSSAAILVQRGWVPRDFVARTQLQTVVSPPGVVVVHGRMALPPSKLYAPGAEVPGAIRQNLDLPAFRGETGLSLMSMTLQQTGASSEGLLREWPAINFGVEKHYGYAIQWFALAALIAGLALWFFVLRPSFFPSPESPSHVP
jgi:surfeit locus 1 family protein